jgi:hypothetical protein
MKAYRHRYLNQSYRLTQNSLSFLLRGHNAGFTSYMNNALNLFLLAESAKMPFHFHVQKEDWAHISWLTFFEDFSQSSDCPIVIELELNDTISDLMTRSQEWVGLEKDENYPFLIQGQNVLIPGGMGSLIGEGRHYFVRPYGENFNELLTASSRMGSDIVYPDKSRIAKAIWNPHRDIRFLVHRIVHNIMDGKPFLAVHIRKGDKIRLEASDVAVERYVTSAIDLCKRNGIDRVFAFSDDQRSIEDFRRQMRAANYTVFTLKIISDLLTASHTVYKMNYYVTQAVGKGGYDHWDYQKAPRDYRLTHTRELIVSISIASRSSHMLCTMSSNVCRFIALLRDSRDTLHSVDGGEWFTM